LLADLGRAVHRWRVLTLDDCATLAVGQVQTAVPRHTHAVAKRLKDGASISVAHPGAEGLDINFSCWHQFPLDLPLGILAAVLLFLFAVCLVTLPLPLAPLPSFNRRSANPPPDFPLGLPVGR
jgi:hypothetical protein